MVKCRFLLIFVAAELFLIGYYHFQNVLHPVQTKCLIKKQNKFNLAKNNGFTNSVILQSVPVLISGFVKQSEIRPDGDPTRSGSDLMGIRPDRNPT